MSVGLADISPLLPARHSPEHKLRGPDIVPELAADGHGVPELDVLLPGAEDGGPGPGHRQPGHQGPDAGGGGGLGSTVIIIREALLLPNYIST